MSQFSQVWNTKDEGPILVQDMKRSHVRNSLQWCLRRLDRSVLGTKDDNFDDGGPYGECDKDGYYYRDWVAIFTARLLDPDLAE